MRVLRWMILVVGLVALGAGGLYVWQQRKPAKRAEMTELRQQLDAAAERSFLVPSLEAKRVEVAAPDGGAAVRETIALAEKFGGTAMQGLDRERAKVVLASVPGKSVDAFLAAVRGKSAPANATPLRDADAGLVDCEVVIAPLAK